MNTSVAHYTYNTPWRDTYLNIVEGLPAYEADASIQVIPEGVILPSVEDPDLYWGAGGVFDEKDQLVESSIVQGPFGKRYHYDRNSLKRIDDSMICLGVLPLHWGHFLIDFICRLWVLVEENNNHKQRLVAYIPRWFDGSLDGNFLECLHLAGFNPEEWIRIETPVLVREILIPEHSMGYATQFSKEKYKLVTERIRLNALEKVRTLSLIPHAKIYFSRRKFSSTDIGEKEIEDNFVRNGFNVLYPEELSIVEQIFYINNAEVVASLSGTIGHNFIFSSNKTCFLILNRFPKPNYPQFRINYIFDLNVTWIDVYNKWLLKHPKDYGDHLIWVEFSKELRNFFHDNGMSYSYSFICAKFRNVFEFLRRYQFMPLIWKIRSQLGHFKQKFKVIQAKYL